MNFYKKKNKKSVFSIKELANLLNVSEEAIKELENGERIAQSVISCIENGAYESPTFLTLYKLNKFFTNDFNKKVKTEVGENIDYTAPSGFGVIMKTGSLMPCSEPIEENKNSSFEIPKECIVEAAPEIENSNVNEQSDLYTEEDLKLVEEEPTSTIIPDNLLIDFISIKRDQYEDMQAKIKRYEKIIDYILKSEN